MQSLPYLCAKNMDAQRVSGPKVYPIRNPACPATDLTGGVLLGPPLSGGAASSPQGSVEKVAFTSFGDFPDLYVAESR